MIKLNSKKGQVSPGLITGLVFGVASLVIGVIIAFVIVSTLTGANLLTAGRTSGSVLNEAGYINQTGYQLASLNTYYIPGTITIDGAINATSNQILTSGNYSIGSTGIISNASTTNYGAAKFNYSYTIYSSEEHSSTALSGNFTAGINNVSQKIPTVFLVAAIVLILGVLVLLVTTWQRMRLGGGDI